MRELVVFPKRGFPIPRYSWEHYSSVIHRSAIVLLIHMTDESLYVTAA